ncbi:MAG: hypothetical protein V4450_06880 [Bacteroidota bacterium]
MKNCLPLLLLLLVFGCKEKKIDLSGEVPVKISDFIAVFHKINPPYAVADSSIARVGDTITIGYKAFTQFFPDSSLTPIVGSNRKLTIHPIGLIEKAKENYLLVKFIAKNKSIHVAVFVTDKKNKYLASKELLTNGNHDEYMHSVSVNREPTFLISKEKMGKDNTFQFTRAGWVYNSAGIFMVVINDSNEDPKKTAVINPIDTLPRKNKFSGDYVQDKKNYISIRDAKKPNAYQFFIHFEKNEGSCTGELKGEMKMKDATNAEFRENGDPCVIDFRFEGNQIILKERGSCGNHRGIKCYFDDSFTKKREPRNTRKK